jgi:hypothetical protein
MMRERKLALQKKLTVDAGVVGLDVDGFDLAVLGDERVAFGAVLAEDGGGFEEEVELFVECAGGVAEEADLLCVYVVRLCVIPDIIVPYASGRCGTYTALGSGVEVLGPGTHAMDMCQSRKLYFTGN